MAQHFWLRALRGGDYPQGKFGMKTPEGGYCCLGVLAAQCGATDVQLSTHAYPHPEFLEATRLHQPVTRREAGQIRSYSWFQGLAGLAGRALSRHEPFSEDGRALRLTRAQVLAVCNDMGLDFPQIATLIEDLGWAPEGPVTYPPALEHGGSAG